jgi:hypothetical protein
MLTGFNYPLTPKGQSTLNPSPPWFYSADFLSIEFGAAPASISALLPRGLEPDRAADGHAQAYFYDWQFSGAGEEYLDPERYQYREFLILVDAVLDGRLISYCPYIFVDNDGSCSRGEPGLPEEDGGRLSNPIPCGDGQGRAWTRRRLEIRGHSLREWPAAGRGSSHPRRASYRRFDPGPAAGREPAALPPSGGRAAR